MGPSIIAHVMLEYYDDQSGWWHELLHELVHGRVSGADVMFKDVLFEEWKDWFDLSITITSMRRRGRTRGLGESLRPT